MLPSSCDGRTDWVFAASEKGNKPSRAATQAVYLIAVPSRTAATARGTAQRERERETESGGVPNQIAPRHRAHLGYLPFDPPRVDLPLRDGVRLGVVPSFEATNIGVEFIGVRWRSRKASTSGIETVGWAERNERREIIKSLRN
jgi:hypothetical protein